MGAWIFLAIVIAVALLWGLPQYFRWRRDRRRRRLIRQIEEQRGSRLITLIHRQEGFSLFLPFGRYIDIDDSEQVLRAIRLTPGDMPIDLVLHTPGGLVLASDQIAHALKRHPGKVTVIVPHYAMSGGTLVALAADEILMDPDAVLGPVDPQLGSLPRGSLAGGVDPQGARAGQPQPRRRDADPRRRGPQGHRPGARHRARAARRPRAGRRGRQARGQLSEGRWTHDYPIRLERGPDTRAAGQRPVPEAIYS